jgi:hypothetical protein
MDLSDLDGAMSKLDRAQDHIDELRRLLAGLWERVGPSFVIEDEGGGSYLYRVVRVPALPRAVSLLVGDALFNIRSALDHLAWQLVLLDGKEPGELTAFPVRNPAKVTDPDAFVNLRPPIDREDILVKILDAQPYRLNGDRHDPQIPQPIWTLHRLNNIDKHRLLLTTATVLDQRQLWWGLPDGVQSPKFQVFLGPVSEGEPVARFVFHEGVMPRDFNPHLVLRVALHEPEFPHLIHVGVDDMLRNFRAVVESIVKWDFGRLFDGWSPLR